MTDVVKYKWGKPAPMKVREMLLEELSAWRKALMSTPPARRDVNPWLLAAAIDAINDLVLADIQRNGT